MTETRCTVLDAGPIIHLDELGCLDLLEGFGALHVPATVWNEVTRHRPRLRPQDIPSLHVVPEAARMSAALATLARSLDLDAGEIAALSLLEQTQGRLFLSDDTAARLAGESLGFTVHGSIGVIVRAIRRGRRTAAEVRGILQAIPERSTLYINPGLLRDAINLIPEDRGDLSSAS